MGYGFVIFLSHRRNAKLFVQFLPWIPLIGDLVSHNKRCLVRLRIVDRGMDWKASQLGIGFLRLEAVGSVPENGRRPWEPCYAQPCELDRENSLPYSFPDSAQCRDGDRRHAQ